MLCVFVPGRGGWRSGFRRKNPREMVQQTLRKLVRWTSSTNRSSSLLPVVNGGWCRSRFVRMGSTCGWWRGGGRGQGQEQQAVPTVAGEENSVSCLVVLLPQGGKRGVARNEVDGVGQPEPKRSELQNGVHL